MLKARESVYWPGISNGIWEAVEKCGTCQSTSKSIKPVGNISEIPPHPWHTLGTDLFYWNRLDFLVVGDNFSKFLIVRKIPNTSTHSVIKELGMIFTEFGHPFVLKSDNGLCYISRDFHDFLEFYQIQYITGSPHHSQSNGFAESLAGILNNLMEKSTKEGKPWNYGLLQYLVTPIGSNLPLLLEAITGRKPRTLLCQIPSSIGKSVESSRIRKELMRHQLNTFTHHNMDLKPGQPVFVKEVHGNIWKTGVIDQPAKEPDSYWIKFPNSFILRRTRSMIKHRSVPSHFELEAEGRERNSTECYPSHASSTFNSLLPIPEQPVLPMGNLVAPPVSERGTTLVAENIPTSSSGTITPLIIS